MVIGAMARITGLLDRVETAEATTDEVLSEQSLRPTIVFFAKTGLALLAVLKGDQSAAARPTGRSVKNLSSASRLWATT